MVCLLYNGLVTHILIINIHSYRNAGDAALATSASRQLHEAFPDSTVTQSINEPTSYTDNDPMVGSFLFWCHAYIGNGRFKWAPSEILRLGIGSVVAVTTYRLLKRPIFLFLTTGQKAFLKVYFDADLVASAPGGFLYSSGKFGLSILIAIYSMVYALWAGKPLYLLPQSVGPLKRSWERWLVQWVFNRARLIMVREETSLQQIRQSRVTNPHILIHPDMAFAYQAAPAEEALHWLQTHGIDPNGNYPLLGITAINWGEQTGQHALQAQYETALADAARHFIERMGGKVVFFPQVISDSTYTDDRPPAHRVVACLPDINKQVFLLESQPAPAVLKAVYGQMDIFIGTRMHSNIFALSGGVPVLAIAYRHKTQGIMQMLGLDEWCIDIQSTSGAVLTERLDALWVQRAAVREHIEQTLPPIIAASCKAGILVADDYIKIQRSSQ